MSDVQIRLGGPLQVLHRRQQDLMDLLRDKEQTISKLQEENATLESEKRDARNSLIELRQEKDEANSHSSQLHQEIQRVAQKLSTYKEENERYQQYSESLERENRSLQQVVDDNNAELERLREENATLHRKVETESTARQRTQKQLDALSNRFEHHKKSMTERINDLNSSIANLESKLQSSEKHVALIQKEKNRLQDELKSSEKHAALIQKEKNRLQDELNTAFLHTKSQPTEPSADTSEERKTSPQRDPVRLSTHSASDTPTKQRREAATKPTSENPYIDGSQNKEGNQGTQEYQISKTSEGSVALNTSVTSERSGHVNPYNVSKSTSEDKGFINSFFYESAAETVTILRNKLRRLRYDYDKLEEKNKRLQQTISSKQIQAQGMKNLKRKETKLVGTDQ